MNVPGPTFDPHIFEHVQNTKHSQKRYLMCDLEYVGEGATGTTFSAHLKPPEQFPRPIIIKQQRRDKYCDNEYNALKFLRECMLNGTLPGYYIFLYGSFTEGRDKNLIMERADYSMDTYMVKYLVTTKTYLQIFHHIARAVHHLERLKFNHGDLWTENVMLVWNREQKYLPKCQRDFTIKLIDYDSAFMENSPVDTPSYGGADKYRTKFIVGYDMNRYFDALLYSHDSYVKEKEKFKKKHARRINKKKKKNPQFKVDDHCDDESCEEDYDRDNIIFPPEIIQFMRSLEPKDPNHFADSPNMSGVRIMQLIEDYALQLGIDLYSNDEIKFTKKLF